LFSFPAVMHGSMRFCLYPSGDMCVRFEDGN
jgi:hypothetical protein